MSNTSGVSPWGSPIIDTGTGAYEGPPASVTYGGVHDPKPTGLVDGPPESVTVESPPEHLTAPTGAHPGPATAVTSLAWPAEMPAAPPATKAIQADEVENKAVATAKTKAASKRPVRKAGA